MANCKKKSTSKNRVVAENTTYTNKVAKLRRQVAKNPNDMIAQHNLNVYLLDGVKARGYGG